MRCQLIIAVWLVGSIFVSIGCESNKSSKKKTPSPPPTINGMNVFPADSPWNTDISSLPVHPDSDSMISVIGAFTSIHFDFGTNPDYGIPFSVVNGSQTLVPINIVSYPAESDPGPMPIPLTAYIEGGSGASGDRHVIALDTDNAMLYELFKAYPEGGGWRCASSAVWDLSDNNLRVAGYTWDSPTDKGILIDWTSADAAGLPILPGLVKYDEAASGEIRHGFRMTIQSSSPGYIHPASHEAPTFPSNGRAVMGMRIRLKASFDESNHPQEIQAILRAMKKYGLIIADNGSNWYISGTSDPRWDDNDLTDVQGGALAVRGSDFEIVNTGAIRQPGD